MKKNCDNCQYKYGNICIGREKDMPIEEARKLYEEDCSEWQMNFEIYMGYNEDNEE